MNYELSLTLSDESKALPPETLALAAKRLTEGAPLSEIAPLSVRPNPAESSKSSAPSDTSAASDAPASSDEAPKALAAEGESAPEAAFSPAAVMAPLASDVRPLTASLRTAPESGIPERIDVSISFELRDRAAFEKTFRRVVEFAAPFGAGVQDPQLSRNVSESDIQSAAAKWEEMREWLLRTDGRSAILVPPNAPLTLPAPSFLERHGKIIALIVGGLIAIAVIQRLASMIFGNWFGTSDL